MIDSKLLTTGYIGEAPAGSIFVTRKHEIAFVLGPSRIATFANNMRRPWQGFEVENNEHWEGVIIPNIGVSVDINLMVHAHAADINPGDVSYRAGVLSLLTAGAVNTYGETLWLPLSADAPDPAKRNFNFGFKAWSVIVGEGRDKETLLTVQNGKAVGGLLHIPS
ncbi:hypothetical protein [Novosphingobium sp. YAF33]|uniref:hypothetical protein n=1 Tax=Novosphingobium sp. YAF33 TaxID=3233082 RepID=UPI003F967F44